MIDSPKWIFVEQRMPKPGTIAAVTNGHVIYNALLRVDNSWSPVYPEQPVIAWLYEPPMETPEPPTIEDHEQWLELTGRKVTP